MSIRNLNRATIMGNLTDDPKLGGSDSPYTFFSVAVNKEYTRKSGEKVKETQFVDCKLFGASAENFCKYMKKGRRILVEGELKQDPRKDKKTGFEYKLLRLYVDHWFFMDSNGKKSEDATKEGHSDEEMERMEEELVGQMPENDPNYDTL